MKRTSRLFIASFTAIILPLTALFAARAESPVCSADAIAGVNGMTCNYCVESIKETLGTQEAVAATEVDLDSAQVTITFKPGQTLDDAAIRQLITEAGYELTSIDRDC